MTVFWVLMNPALAVKFDQVLVFANGKIVERGTVAELSANGGTFAKLKG